METIDEGSGILAGNSQYFLIENDAEGCNLEVILEAEKDDEASSALVNDFSFNKKNVRSGYGYFLE